MRELPTGTVTFLFTDVEGSTRLLQELEDDYAAALAAHRRALRDIFARHDGVEVDTQGDAFFVAFARATDALGAASAIAGLPGPLRVRIGLHTGEPLVTDEGYVGLDVTKAARICAAGSGGQVLVSEATARLLDDALRDVGLHRLKDLGEPVRLFQLGDDEFPRLRTLNQTNLPPQPTPFIGRERELADVIDLTRSRRLVTLTGPGGSGKTRLALQAAAELVDDYSDGVWWVPLQALSDHGLVMATIAATIGAADDLVGEIGGKRMLLLVDNFEQVIGAAPDLADALGACPELALMVTSREPLRIAVEREYEVRPLLEHEAVSLFLERAHTREEPAAVHAICRRLDNLPLAIELAASRVRAIAPAQLLERLDRALPLLTGGPRDAPDRQRTLRATIEWSYELLEPEERDAFARLAVFSGGWTLDAAESVTDTTLDDVDRLVAQSLVQRTGDRYTMLETVREFARELFERRDDATDVARRHAAYFRALDERLGPIQSRAARDPLLRESDNVRAAVTWALANGEYETATHFASFLQSYRLSHAESLGWLEAVLAAPDAVDDAARGRLLVSAGDIATVSGRHDDARAFLTQCLELGRALEDRNLECESLRRLGDLAKEAGDPDAARAHYAAALRAAEETGDARHYCGTLHHLGELERDYGDLQRSRELILRALELALDDDRLTRAAYALHGLGDTALAAGDLVEAAGRYSEALKLADRTANLRTFAPCLAGLAAVAAFEDDAERAGRLWGAAHAAEHELGWPLSAFERRRYDDAIARLPDAAFDLHVAAGRALGLDAAVEYALASVH